MGLGVALIETKTQDGSRAEPLHVFDTFFRAKKVSHRRCGTEFNKTPLKKQIVYAQSMGEKFVRKNRPHRRPNTAIKIVFLFYKSRTDKTFRFLP